MELYFVFCAMACFKINDNKKRVMMFEFVAPNVKYPFFITITAVLIDNCIVLYNINFFSFF